MDKIIAYLQTLDNFSQLIVLVLCFLLIARFMSMVANIFRSIFGPKIIYKDKTSENIDDE